MCDGKRDGLCSIIGKTIEARQEIFAKCVAFSFSGTLRRGRQKEIGHSVSSWYEICGYISIVHASPACARTVGAEWDEADGRSIVGNCAGSGRPGSWERMFARPKRAQQLSSLASHRRLSHGAET